MKSLFKLPTLFALFAIAFTFVSCDTPNMKTEPTSSSGVTKATTTVAKDMNGHTTEQNNIIARYTEDNKPGSIKHLYIISAYSGQVLIYSTVKGKVTSSGKRLTPLSVAENSSGFNVSIDNDVKVTNEVLQDDGTYGNSVEYIYWFDSKGVYHQQYITGGMILHVSSQPLNVKGVTINMEITNDTK